MRITSPCFQMAGRIRQRSGEIEDAIDECRMDDCCCLVADANGALSFGCETISPSTAVP